jgi:hypothetical protein
MSVEQLEQSVLNLTLDERRRFVDWIVEHESEILPDGQGDLDPEVKAEILRRRDLADARPELLAPWETTTARVRAKLHELRRQKAAAR